MALFIVKKNNPQIKRLISNLIILLSFLLIGIYSFSTKAKDTGHSDKKVNPEKELNLNHALKAFNKGDYSASLKILFSLSPEDTDDKAKINYWIGVNQNKLQLFSASAYHLSRAIHFGFDQEDIYYEYGQALYGSQELEKSRTAFLESIQKEDFKSLASTYYIAYISQLLEEFEMAKNYYRKVLQNSDRDLTITQSAKFQLASVNLLELEADKQTDFHKKSEIVRMDIIPQLNNSLFLWPESALAREIHQKIQELKKKYQLAPLTMANGRKIPDDPWNFKLSEKIEYDSNVVLEGDDFIRSNQDTNISSFINDTELNFGRRFILFNRRVAIYPELLLTRKFHTERKNDAIFQNDSYTLTPTIRSVHEHTLYGKMASTLFDFDHIYTARDYQRNGDIIFYSRILNFSLGERAELWEIGESTIKFKYRIQSGYNQDIDYNLWGVYLNQNFVFENKHRLITILNIDVKNAERSIDSQNSFNLKGSYLIPRIDKGWIFLGNFGLTITDTKEQKSKRGTEFKINPGIGLVKQLNNWLDFTFAYDFIKNTSDDTANYAYTKHVIGIGLKLEM
jgi:Tfp pilus assembly protein PilF